MAGPAGPKACMKTAGADLRDAEELLGIVAGEQFAVGFSSNSMAASGIASSHRSPAGTAAACEPMAGIACQHASRADVGRSAPFAFESARLAPRLHYYLVAGGRERNYG